MSVDRNQGVSADVSLPGTVALGYGWTIAGLYEWYRPRGVTFFGATYVVVGMQGVEEAVGRPSLLVFYKRNSREVYKLIELWMSPGQPFYGTCGGVALTGQFLYVTDDTRQEGWVIGYSRSDIESQLGSRAPGKVYVTTARGKALMINLGYTASSLSFDPDFNTPRLWVGETFYNETDGGERPAIPTKSLGFTGTVTAATLGDDARLLMELDGVQAAAEAAAAGYGSAPAAGPLPVPVPRQLQDDDERSGQKRACEAVKQANVDVTDPDKLAKYPSYCCTDFSGYGTVGNECAEPPEPSASPSSAPSMSLMDIMIRNMTLRFCGEFVEKHRNDNADDRPDMPVQCRKYNVEWMASNETVVDPNAFDNSNDAAESVLLPTNSMQWAKLAGFNTDDDGLLVGWPATTLKAAVEIGIGPEARGAVFGYREYAGGPQNVIINRCVIKRGFSCKLEFHELPASAAGKAKFSLVIGVPDKTNSVEGGVSEDKSAGAKKGGKSGGSSVARGGGAKGRVNPKKGGAGPRGKSAQKAKSAQNAGSKQMKDSNPKDGALVTLLQGLRIPSAASGISFEPQTTNGVTVSRKLAVVFSGCSAPDHRAIAQMGLDCEDQLRVMNLPVLRAFKPSILVNRMFLVRGGATTRSRSRLHRQAPCVAVLR